MASSTSNMTLLVHRQPTCVLYFNVLYFDQQTGVVHPICQSKYAFTPHSDKRGGNEAKTVILLKLKN